MATVTTNSPGLGRVRRSDLPFVDVTLPPYSVIGDGVFDCTSRIQSAIDYVGTNKGTLFFPAGTYLVTSELDFEGIQSICVLGEGGRSSIIKFDGAADTRSVLYCSSFAYSRIEGIGINMNSKAKIGLNLTDDEGAVAGVTLDNHVSDITFYNQNHADGAAFWCGTPTGDAWQVSENDIQKIHFANCLVGLVINGSQTINCTFSGITESEAKASSLSIDVRGGWNNTFKQVFSVSDMALRVRTSADGVGFILDGLYVETNTTAISFDDDAAGKVTHATLKDVNIYWSGTTTATDIIFVGSNANVTFEHPVIRAVSYSTSKGRLNFDCGSAGIGGTGAVTFIDGPYFVNFGPGNALEVYDGFSVSKIGGVEGAPRIFINNRHIQTTAGNDAIVLERDSAFGTMQNNDIKWTTVGDIDAYMRSTPGESNSVSAFDKNALELLRLSTGKPTLFAPVIVPSASVTPGTNGHLVFEATSNTSVTVKLKGSDGTVRTVVLTLA